MIAEYPRVDGRAAAAEIRKAMQYGKKKKRFPIEDLMFHLYQRPQKLRATIELGLDYLKDKGRILNRKGKVVRTKKKKANNKKKTGSAKGSSKTSGRKLKDIFDEIDDDNSGTISKLELVVLLKSLSQNLPMTEMFAIFEKMDRDGDGEVSFKEFAQWWKGRRATTISKKSTNSGTREREFGQSYDANQMTRSKNGKSRDMIRSTSGRSCDSKGNKGSKGRARETEFDNPVNELRRQLSDDYKHK